MQYYRCSRCGRTIQRDVTIVNGVPLCRECAEQAGIPNFTTLMDSQLKLFDNEIASMMPMLSGIDFSPAKQSLRCPRCNTSLTEYQSKGLVGCIECYNVFGEYINRAMMKAHGTSSYKGKALDDDYEKLFDAISEIEERGGIRPGMNSYSDKAKDAQVDATSKTESIIEEKASQKSESGASKAKLEKLAKADLGMLSNEELSKAIDLAVEAEDYMLAARFRDELKGRGEN